MVLDREPRPELIVNVAFAHPDFVDEPGDDVGRSVICVRPVVGFSIKVNRPIRLRILRCERSYSGFKVIETDNVILQEDATSAKLLGDLPCQIVA
jgi:hypothetical protein